MIYSQDEKVQKFLEDLEATKLGEFEIIQKVREIVKAVYPDVQERMMYGGIMFTCAEKDLGGAFPYTNHVSLEFSNGALFDDPDKLLQGGGKYRRHLKFGSVDEVDESIVRGFLEQAV